MVVKMLAVVRLRGHYNIRGKFDDTMDMIHLTKINSCVVLPEEPSYVGMVEKIKNQVTYGPIQPGVLAHLIKKRGRLAGDKRLTEKWLHEKGFKKWEDLANALIEGKTTVKTLGLKPLFRLTPAAGGLKSTRVHYPRGDLGNRGEKINALLTRMI
jgi:large subunit ribosomal protein L30